MNIPEQAKKLLTEVEAQMPKLRSSTYRVNHDRDGYNGGRRDGYKVNIGGKSRGGLNSGRKQIR